MADLSPELQQEFHDLVNANDGKLKIENKNGINLKNFKEPTEVIELEYNNCQNISLSGIEKMTNLTKLIVRNCTFTDGGLSIFTQPVEKNDKDKDFDDIPKDYVIQDLEYLTELVFDNCGLTDLSSFQYVRRLEVVGFPRNQFTTITPLSKYRHVKEFDIQDNKNLNADVNSLEGFNQLKKELMVIQMFVGLRKINVDKVPLFEHKRAQEALYYVIPEITDENKDEMQISIAGNENVLKDSNILSIIKDIQKEPPKDFEENGVQYSYQDLIHHFIITAYDDLEYLYDQNNKIPQQIEEVLQNNNKLNDQVKNIETKHKQMMTLMKSIEDRLTKVEGMLTDTQKVYEEIKAEADKEIEKAIKKV